MSTIKIVCLLMILTCCQVAVVEPLGNAETYYLDSDNGDDDNDGTSAENAWKSLDKVNAHTFMPADKMLFKAGCVWNGQLSSPKGSGEDGMPIVVDK